MVFEKIQKIIAEQLGIETEEVKIDTSFEKLGIDSLEIFEIVMSIEDEFDLEIPNEDVEKITNVKDTVKYIESKIN